MARAALGCVSHSQLPEFGIQAVPEPVTKQVERQDDQGDGQPWQQRQPPGSGDFPTALGHHLAPGRHRGWDTSAQETERRLGQDDHPDMPGKYLTRLAWAVNTVWNFCNEVSLLAWRHEKRFLSAFDLINLTAGAGHELGLHTDTISEVCQEYALRKKTVRKIRLKLAQSQALAVLDTVQRPLYSCA